MFERELIFILGSITIAVFLCMVVSAFFWEDKE